MIRIILLSTIFLYLEFFGVASFLKHLDSFSGSLWKINFSSDDQRRVFKIIDKLQHIKDNSIVVFGGSATREFFVQDSNITKTLQQPFYNCATSSQTPFDSYKLQHLLATNNHIIMYGLHPKSVYDASYNIFQIQDGYFFGGKYLKYPIFLNNLKEEFKIDEKKINYIHRLSPELNVYNFLLKDYVKNILKTRHLLNYNEPKQYYYQDEPLDLKIIENKLDDYFLKIKRDNNLNLNFSIIEKMIQLAQKQKNRFVLFELPFSPIIEKRFQIYFTQYYDKIKNLLEKYPNLLYISNKNFLPSKQKLFFDTVHLLPDGRKYYYFNSISLLKRAIANDR